MARPEPRQHVRPAERPKPRPDSGSAEPVDREFRRAQTEIFVCFQRIVREGERRVADLLAQYRVPDITPAQANALMVIIEQRGPVTARQLAGLLSVSEVTAGRFVKALERSGWVERLCDPEDSRARLIRPTRKARRWLPRFFAVANTVMDEAFAGFERDAMLGLGREIRRLQDNLVGGKPPSNARQGVSSAS